MAVRLKVSNFFTCERPLHQKMMRLPSHGGDFNKFFAIVGFSPPLCFATLHIYVYGNTSKENSFMLTCRKLKQSRLTRPYLGTWKIKTAFSKYKFWNIVSISPCPTTMPVKRVEREVENRKGRRCSP